MVKGYQQLVEPRLAVGVRRNSSDDAEVADAPPVSGGNRSTTAAINGEAVTTAAHFRPARFEALLADRTLRRRRPRRARPAAG
jgi:hypothetical protein